MNLYCNGPFKCKFKCISYQIDDYLLNSIFIIVDDLLRLLVVVQSEADIFFLGHYLEHSNALGELLRQVELTLA